MSFGKSGSLKGSRGGEGGSAAIKAVRSREGEISFKGSELDRSLSYGRISKELAQNRRVLGLEQPHLNINGNKDDYTSPSSIPAFSPIGVKQFPKEAT